MLSCFLSSHILINILRIFFFLYNIDMPDIGRVNAAVGRWMPLVVVGLGASQLGWNVLYALCKSFILGCLC